MPAFGFVVEAARTKQLLTINVPVPDTPPPSESFSALIVVAALTVCTLERITLLSVLLPDVMEVANSPAPMGRTPVDES